MNNGYVLITGADGRLGGALVKELVSRGQSRIACVSLEKQMTYDMLDREHITDRSGIVAMDQEDFFSGSWSGLDVSVAIHMAFARGNRPSAEIADSLDYARRVYQYLYDMKVPRIVYLSSQSVYGKISEWRVETLPPSPESIYAMAKYAGEKLLESRFKGVTGVEYSVLRLDYVIQSQKLIPTLCKNAKEKGVLTLRGGKQTFSYIDKSDVATAIAALLNYDGTWKPLYNVGHNRMRYSLLDMANIVASVAQSHGAGEIKIELTEDDTELWSGIDSSSFMNDTGWKPSMDVRQMVEAIYENV